MKKTRVKNLKKSLSSRYAKKRLEKWARKREVSSKNGGILRVTSIASALIAVGVASRTEGLGVSSRSPTHLSAAAKYMNDIPSHEGITALHSTIYQVPARPAS